MNVVITGANKGLGFHLAKLFTANGHQVLAGVFAGYNPAQINAVAASNAGNIRLAPMDITDEASVCAAAETARNFFGSVDLLIGNAGILLNSDRTDTICDLPITDLRKTIEVNTIGTVIVMKYFMPLMRTDGRGMMIFITSEAGSLSSSGSNFPAYSISKAAANKAVFILKATAGNKCRIYAMHPGRMNTDMGRTTAQIEPEESAESIYRIATGEITVACDGLGYINYKGEAMPI